MDEKDWLVLGGAVLLMWFLVGRKTSEPVVTEPGISGRGLSGTCGAALCMGTTVSTPSIAETRAPQVLAPPQGLVLAAGAPTREQIEASNLAGFAYVDPATARQSWMIGEAYNPYWYGG